MKATLLFAVVAMALAGSKVLAASELEALREKCARQEQEIRRLEALVRPQQAAATKAVSTSGTVVDTSTYTVRKGDSLERIARRHGTTVTALAKVNGIRTSKVIHPGQRLKLPGKPAVSSSAVAAATSKPAAAPVARVSGSHKVAAGETFSSISRKHRIPVQDLLAANPGIQPTQLRAGQTIRLGGPAPKPATQAVAHQQAPARTPSQPQVTSKPASAALSANVMPVSTIATPPSAPVSVAETAPPAAAQTSQPPATPAAPSPDPTPVVESSPAPNTEKKIRSVTIEGEMTYGEFAAKHGTDPDRLNDLNGLDLTHATVLAKGSELYVPAQP